MDKKYKDIHILANMTPKNMEVFTMRMAENVEISDNTLHFDVLLPMPQCYGVKAYMHYMINLDVKGMTLVID